MAIRLDKLLDAWRSDPRPKATVEFCAMLVRASSKPGASNPVPREFVVEFGHEALERHPGDIEVGLSVAGLYVTAGELDRAEQLAAQTAERAPGDGRITKLLSKVRLHRGVRGGSGMSSMPPGPMPRGISFAPSQGPPPAESDPPPAAIPSPAAPVAIAPVAVPSFLSELPEVRSSAGKAAAARAGASGSFAPPPVYSESGEPMPESIPGQESTADPDDEAPTAYRPVPDEVRRAALAAAPPPAPRLPTVRGVGPNDPMVQAALEARRLRNTAAAPTFPDPDDEPSTLGGSPGIVQAPAPFAAPPREGAVDLGDQPDDDQGETEVHTLLHVPPPTAAAPIAPPQPGPHRPMPTLQSPGVHAPLPAAGGPTADEDTEDGPRTVVKTQRLDAVELPPHLMPPRSAPPPPAAPESPGLFRGISSQPPEDKPAYPAAMDFPNAQTSSLPQLPLIRPGQAGPGASVASPPSHPMPPPPPAEVSMPLEPPPIAPTLASPLASHPGALPYASQSPPARPARAPSILNLVLVLIALSALVAAAVFGYLIYGGGEADVEPDEGANAAGKYPEIEAKLFLGGPRDLDDAARAIDEVAAGASDAALAMMRLRERALRALEGSEPPADLGAAIAEARERGAGDADVAFGELAAALADDRLTEVEDSLKRSSADPALRSDAFFQLVSGAAMERLGRPEAASHFQAALGAEPRLQLAEVRLIRGMLLYGDAVEGRRRAAAFAEQRAGRAEAKVLRALAWVGERRTSAATSPPGALPSEEDLPRSLRAVYPAIAMVTATDPRARERIFDAGLAASEAPAVAAFYGELALETGQPRWGLRAADRGLSLAPGHAASLSLLGRAALETGQLDRLTRAITEAPTGTATELEAVEAYEKGDHARLAGLAEGLSDQAGGSSAGIVAREERMRGIAPLSPEQISRLKGAAMIGGDLVIADAQLDAGDLEAARETISAWPQPTEHPLRALRYARLLRYERKLEDAQRALEAAAPTRPAQLERILLEAETADGRQHALAVLGKHLEPERPFLEAYLEARQGEASAAERIVADAKPPAPKAPLSERLAAALAYGEVGLRSSGERVIRDLMLAFPNNPDVVRAAVGLRLLPRSRLDDLSTEPDESAAP